MLSMREVHRSPAYAAWYEFEDVAASLGNVDIVAMPAYHGDLRFDTARKLYQVARRAGASSAQAMARLPLASDVAVGRYDLVVVVAAGLFDLIALRYVEAALDTGVPVVAWLVEAWPDDFGSRSTVLQPHELFDRVFVSAGNPSGLGAAWGRDDVELLPPGVSVLAQPPADVSGGPRPMLAFNPGRRSPEQHKHLLEIAKDLDRFYLFDTMGGGQVSDLHQHRTQYHSICRHSDVVISNFARFDELDRIKGARTASARPAEAAAGGALIVGAQPPPGACAESWIDGLVVADVSLEPTKAELLEALTNSALVDQARRVNQIVAARRLDWAYHWAHLLAAGGIREPAGLSERLEQLENRARTLDLGR